MTQWIVIIAFFTVLNLSACTPGGPAPIEVTETKPQDIQDKTASLIRLGDRMAAAGDPGAALGFYQQAHIKQPQLALPFTKQATVFLNLGQTKKAGNALFAATEADPGNAEAAITYARFLIDHDIKKAPIFLQTARDRFQTARFENWLGVALDLNGRHDEAQTIYQRGLNSEPGNLSIMNNLGLSLAVTGQKQQAYRTLQGILERDPDNILYHKNLAIARIINGDIDDARLTLLSVMPEEEINTLIKTYDGALKKKSALAVLKQINHF